MLSAITLNSWKGVTSLLIATTSQVSIVSIHSGHNSPFCRSISKMQNMRRRYTSSMLKMVEAAEKAFHPQSIVSWICLPDRCAVQNDLLFYIELHFYSCIVVHCWLLLHLKVPTKTKLTLQRGVLHERLGLVVCLEWLRSGREWRNEGR